MGMRAREQTLESFDGLCWVGNILTKSPQQVLVNRLPLTWLGGYEMKLVPPEVRNS